MKRQYLFPAKCQKIGWVLMILAAIYLILQIVLFYIFSIDIDFSIKMPALYQQQVNFTDNTNNNLYSIGKNWFSIAESSICNTIVPVAFLVGGLLVGFSKEKKEDELIIELRERSLIWAMLIGYCILIFAYLFIYGIIFLYVSRFIVDLFLLLYIIKFKIELYKLKKQEKNEE